MRSNRNLNDKVAVGAAVMANVTAATDRKCLCIINSCGDINLAVGGVSDFTLTATGFAGLFNGFTCAAALITGALCLNIANRCSLLNCNSAGASASGTGNG